VFSSRMGGFAHIKVALKGLSVSFPAGLVLDQLILYLGFLSTSYRVAKLYSRPKAVMYSRHNRRLSRARKTEGYAAAAASSEAPESPRLSNEGGAATDTRQPVIGLARKYMLIVNDCDVPVTLNSAEFIGQLEAI
jgi:hypothetical protein